MDWGGLDDEETVTRAVAPVPASQAESERLWETPAEAQSDLGRRQRQLMEDARREKRRREFIYREEEKLKKFIGRKLPAGVLRDGEYLEETNNLGEDEGGGEYQDCFPNYPWRDPRGPRFRVEFSKQPKFQLHPR